MTGRKGTSWGIWKGKTCSIPTCPHPVRCMGLCKHHYDKHLLAKQRCSVTNCQKSVFSLGMCRSHYHLFKKYGDVHRRTRFSQNEFVFAGSVCTMFLYDKNGAKKERSVLFDTEDYHKIKEHKWHGDGRYVSTHINNIPVSLHHFVLNILEKTGRSKLTDHKNRDGYDCQKQNLRDSTPGQNRMNSRIGRTNTSGYTGVHYNKQTGSWSATVILDAVSHYLGSFISKKEAIEARKVFEKENFGEFIPKQHLEEQV